MEWQNDVDPHRERARKAATDGCESETAGTDTCREPESGAAVWRGTERGSLKGSRLPSIDDYDWERGIERIARKLSPHHQSSDETKGVSFEQQALPPPAEAPGKLGARDPEAARPPPAQPLDEPASRRPVGVLFAGTIPVLAIATALPFVQGMPAWTDGFGSRGEPAVAGIIFQPARHADAVVRQSHRDAPPPAAVRQASRAAHAAGPELLYQRTTLPSAVEAEALALATAQERRTRETGQSGQAQRVAAPFEPAQATPAGAEASSELLPLAQAGPAAEPRAAGPQVPKEQKAPPASGPESADADTDGQQPGLRSLTNGEIEELMARGHQLLEIGDVASARLLFLLVAEAGDARGAKAMGMTYDPRVLSELPIAGMAPDNTQAEIWYERSDAMRTRPAGDVVEATGGRPGGD
jgi:hypothetical protein